MTKKQFEELCYKIELCVGEKRFRPEKSCPGNALCGETRLAIAISRMAFWGQLSAFSWSYVDKGFVGDYFCHPNGGPIMDNLNVGQYLAGDRIYSSPFVLTMKEELYCQQLCISFLGIPEQRGIKKNKVVRAIRWKCHNNWIVDNLPAASKVQDGSGITSRYWQGFPVGFVAEDSGLAYVYNHVNIEIMFHPVEDESETFRIVRFTVEPFSIKHEFEINLDDAYPQLRSWATIKNPIPSCRENIPEDERMHTSYDMVTDTNREPQEASGRVLFTYDVTWIQNDDLKWASRWDG